mmetsp:Transcript_61080/g.126057  ORF Transcript_61080/g.126057 Transcript_61080/m.126057 type:complete len:214 (-) Transcript_61080:2217-2858(-)
MMRAAWIPAQVEAEGWIPAQVEVEGVPAQVEAEEWEAEEVPAEVCPQIRDSPDVAFKDAAHSAAGEFPHDPSLQLLASKQDCMVQTIMTCPSLKPLITQLSTRTSQELSTTIGTPNFGNKYSEQGITSGNHKPRTRHSGRILWRETPPSISTTIQQTLFRPTSPLPRELSTATLLLVLSTCSRAFPLHLKWLSAPPVAVSPPTSPAHRALHSA